MAMDKDGKVGIGTASPAAALEIQTVSGAQDANIRLDANGVNSNQHGIEWYSNTTQKAEITWGENSANLRIRNFRNDANASYGRIDFDVGGSNWATNPSTRMAIDGNTGNVGIGTTAPKANLHVNVTGTSDGFLVGGKNLSLNTSYQTGAQLEVTLGDHQACYVKVFITGDWGGHSAMTFLGEYFIQNGSDGYAEPGMIIREVENTNGIDSVSSRIYDGGAYDSFQIQFKLNVPSGASTQTTAGNLTYQIMGQFDAIS
jgi:hypothetical protein